jgi:alpha-L-rhamnosidase
MMAYSLGIQRDEPGFRKFILQPEPDPTGQMTWAEGYYDSMYGRIKSAWKISDNKISFSFTVPPNTTAKLYLPAWPADSEDYVTESGKPTTQAKGVKFIKSEDVKLVYELTSGNFEFVIEK